MAKESFPSFSKYEILGVLGQGSMGTVYKAHHALLGRMVALKVPRRETVRNKTATERFLREGRALAMLQHPHVVNVFDADEESGFPYIVMEYVEGGTLSSYIRQSKQLALPKVELWVIQIAEALDYIHSKGILHRDLKSSNVLISSDGQARITDFGIAHIDTQATITDGLLGTPAYMSPEQAKGGQLDRRSDIYSLGVILYEALTGRIPFIDDNGLALIQKIIHDMPTQVEEYRSDTPAWLAGIVHRCLQKDPQQRYQTGAQLALDMREKRTGFKVRADHIKKAVASRASTITLQPVKIRTARYTAVILSILQPMFREIPGHLRKSFEQTSSLLLSLHGFIKPKLARTDFRRLLQPPLVLVLFLFIIVVMLWMFAASSQDAESESAAPVQVQTETDSSDSDASTPPVKRKKPSWQPWP